MNGYIGFYESKQHEFHAESSYKAQQLAVAFFHPPKSKAHMVHVHLTEKEGQCVIHQATE